MKKDIFAANALPVELTAAADRQVEQKWSMKKLLALILAALSFRPLSGPVGVAVSVTLSLDTSAYTANDVLAATQAITGALAAEGNAAIIQSLTLLDKDDNTAAGIDLVFLRSNVSLGTENSAPDISDANAAEILGIVSIASGDFIDLGGAKVATKTGLNLQVSATEGTSIYVAAITRGTPTQTASGIVLNLSLRQD